MMSYYNFGLVFLISFTICGVLVWGRKRYMPLLRSRNDVGARQALHRDVTPRLGGVGIMVAIALALLIVPQSLTKIFALFAVSLLPVVLTGLAEDLGYRVMPRWRLLAAAASSLAMIIMLNMWITTTGIWALDYAFQLALVSIPITVLWSTGICHGFNLIDGVNGLASGLGIAISLGMWWIAYENQQVAFMLVSFALVLALSGFLIFNWPYGRIFLGDAGAYGIGHTLVWLSILLAWQLPDVSYTGLSLMFFWPVADTFLAIWRRRQSGKPVDAPDRMHFHQLIYRLLMQMYGNQISPKAVNSLTGLIILPFAAAPVVAAVMLYQAPYLALAAWLIFGFLFVLTYMQGIAVFRNRRLCAERQFSRAH